MRFLRGGDEVTGATLTRFYGIHVAVLPAAMTVLLGVHLLLIQRQGMSVPPRVEQRARAGERIDSIPFVPHYVLHDLMWWYVALAVLAALALFLPWELGKKADAFAPVPPGIRPEWYFLAMFQVLKMLPAHVLGIEGELLGILGFSVAALALLCLPFLDRGAADGRSSKLVTVAGIAALAYLVAFTIYGYLAA
jgi:quinol-cytochrome oxidoreductase complex cytochrome b subunit